MVENNKNFKTIEEKLSLLKYKPETISHIEVDKELCLKCKSKECTFFCPASVYKIEEGEVPKIEYENCLECGACKIGCKSKSVKWNFPHGGCGIVYKFS